MKFYFVAENLNKTNANVDESTARVIGNATTGDMFFANFQEASDYKNGVDSVKNLVIYEKYCH